MICMIVTYCKFRHFMNCDYEAVLSVVKDIGLLTIGRLYREGFGGN